MEQAANPNMEELRGFLNKGVSFEEEFIITYMKMVRDEGFLKDFKDPEETKKLLSKLVKESTEHKDTLTNIINKFESLWI